MKVPVNHDIPTVTINRFERYFGEHRFVTRNSKNLWESSLQSVSTNPGVRPEANLVALAHCPISTLSYSSSMALFIPIGCIIWFPYCTCTVSIKGLTNQIFLFWLLFPCIFIQPVSFCYVLLLYYYDQSLPFCQLYYETVIW